MNFVKANIFHHLRSLIGFRTLTNFHWLLLLSSAPLLWSASAIVCQAAPQKIAQVLVENPIARPALKIGSQGQSVTELQAALKLLGMYSGSIDGIFSNATAAAVTQFQQAAGLNPDGVVNLDTWQKLFPGIPTETAVATNTVQVINPPTSKPSITPAVNNTVKPSTSVKPAKQPTSTLKPATPPKRTTNKPAPPKTAVRSPRQTTRDTASKPKPAIQYTAQGHPILRLGMRGDEVVKLQKKLSSLGFLKSGVDGDYGPLTEDAVKAFQKRNGLEEDGIAGGATWNLLLSR